MQRTLIFSILAAFCLAGCAQPAPERPLPTSVGATPLADAPTSTTPNTTHTPAASAPAPAPAAPAAHGRRQPPRPQDRPRVPQLRALTRDDDGADEEERDEQGREQGFIKIARDETERRAAPLSAEDQLIQSMPDASPAKWHRAHTTWFFEQFLLGEHVKGYTPLHPDYAYLFNSYYVSAGPRHARHQRGHLTRPTADEVTAYRRHVDAEVVKFFRTATPEKLEALVPLVAPERTAELAIAARETMKLRHAPLLVVREMARHPTHRGLVADTLARVIQRPDEMTELLAIYWADALGPQQQRKRQPVSAQIKKGLARALTKFDAYQLAKYDRDGAVRIKEIGRAHV